MKTSPKHPSNNKLLPNDDPTTSSNQEWESFCQQIKSTMTGSDQEKDDILRRRLLKFFHSFSLEQNRYYVERRQAFPSQASQLLISTNAIMLYGIDFLSQSKIQKYFLPFQVAVEYYDDSHCSVSFKCYDHLVRSVYNRMQKTTLMLDDYQVFYQKLTENNLQRLVWRELEPYYELCFQRSLCFRFLTNHDFHNKGQMGQTAIHQTYLIAKNNFFKDIKKTFDKKSQEDYNQRSGSRDSSLSRSGGRSRSRQNRKNRSNYSHYMPEKQCGCHCLSNELKKFIHYAESKPCTGCSSKKRKNNEEGLRKRSYYSEIESKNIKVFTPKKQASRPMENFDKREQMIVQRTPSNKRSKIPRNKETKERGDRLTLLEEEMELSEDSMVGSLVRELQKYKFDEEEVNFERHMSRHFDRQRSVAFSHRQPTINMDQETVVQIIQEQ